MENWVHDFIRIKKELIFLPQNVPYFNKAIFCLVEKDSYYFYQSFNFYLLGWQITDLHP